MPVLSTHLAQSLHRRLLREAADRYWARAEPSLEAEFDRCASRCCLNDLVEEALEETWTAIGRPAGRLSGEPIDSELATPTKWRRRPRRKHRAPRVKFTTTISESHSEMLRSISQVRDQPYAQVVEEALNSLLMKGHGDRAAALGQLLFELIPVGGAPGDAALLLRQICH